MLHAALNMRACDNVSVFATTPKDWPSLPLALYMLRAALNVRACGNVSVFAASLDSLVSTRSTTMSCQDSTAPSLASCRKTPARIRDGDRRVLAARIWCDE